MQGRSGTDKAVDCIEENAGMSSEREGESPSGRISRFPE